MSAPGRHLPHDWFPDPVPANVALADGVDLWSSVAFVQFCSRDPEAVRIGPRSGVYPGVMFDLGPDGRVEIGADCMLGEVTFSTNHRIVIGDLCLAARCSVLADGPFAVPRLRSDVDAPSAPPSPDPVIVLEDNVWLGQHAVVLAGAHIGTGAVIGMKTVVDFEVPPYAIVAGNPPRIIGDTRERG